MRKNIKKALILGGAASILCSVTVYGSQSVTKSQSNTKNNNIIQTYTRDMYNIEETIENYLNQKEQDSQYQKGWTTTSVNIRKKPNTRSKILTTLIFNTEVSYKKYNDDWVQITYDNEDAYISKDYISNTKCQYKTYTVKNNNGFKSFMPYTTITSTDTPQYYLQENYAYTGKYGIRQVNGRYCVALGSYFTTEIGQLFDIVLENGTVIPCVLADQKDDKHTDQDNITTARNGCISEFVVETGCLSSKVRKNGSISYCTKSWNSPVVKIVIYDKNILTY